jgi:NTE family protein
LHDFFYDYSEERSMQSKLLMLALQGGGALGALGWGVLDRLLEEPEVRIESISGASAGAMNAVALAHGWSVGGAAGARRALEAFWTAVGECAAIAQWPHDLQTAAPWMPSPGRFMLGWTRFFSPAQFNPLDINPLRTIVTQQFDFERLRAASPIRLFVAATAVRSGALHVFKDGELTPDHLLASACLPALHHAVMIDGEAYWDGGYTGNPPLFPLTEGGRASDLLLVPLLPTERADVPTDADGIRARLAEIHFNTTLLRELDALAIAQRTAREQWWDWSAHARRLRRLRVHRINTNAFVRELTVDQTLQAGSGFLCHLRDAGRRLAADWLRKPVVPRAPATLTPQPV